MADNQTYTADRITGLRRLIATRMAESHSQIPGVHVVEECDLTELNMRHLVALVATSVATLAVDHPLFNAHFIDDEIRLFERCRLGFAVDTPRGLVVPVVEVDARVGSVGLEELSHRIADLAERARAGRLTGSEVSGGTITLTSPGKSGGVLATPLINPPQTAIIGVHRAVWRPCVIDGVIEARRMLNLTVTFDHRVIDGAEAGRYARSLRALIESGTGS